MNHLVGIRGEWDGHGVVDNVTFPWGLTKDDHTSSIGAKACEGWVSEGSAQLGRVEKQV